MAKLATEDNEELAHTLDNIYVNASNGERELIMLGRTLNDDTANELRRRGFKVEFFGDGEFINTSIEW